MKKTIAIMLVIISYSTNGQIFSFTNAPNAPITVVSSMKGLTAADLNSDGHTDIVACPAYYNGLYVFLGNGNGQFSQASGSPFTLSNGPMAAAVADYNGDGKPDIATANYNSSNVSVLIGNGSGGFTHASGSPHSTGSNPYYIEAADFNSDGKMDLISTTVGGSAVYMHHGLGNGTFSLAAGFPIAAPGMPYHVTTGKFNNDNYTDFVVLNHNAAQAKVYLGTSTGTFVAGPGSPFSTPVQPRTIRLSDLNNDGSGDLVISCASGSAVAVYLGTTSGSFAVAPGSPMNMGMATYMSTIADFDLDGKKDIVVSGHNDAALVLRGAGNGSFSASGTTLTMGYAPQPICTADFDEDGRPDFAMGDFWGSDLNIQLNSSCNLSGSIAQNVGIAGQVTFSASGNATVPATTYSWSFGATAATASHSFLPGVHTVTLSITNPSSGNNCYYTATSTFTVVQCSIAGGITHTVGSSGLVNFSAAVSGTVSASSYQWSFGSATSTGATTTYTFLPGTYVVTLTVNNNYEGSPCIQSFTTTVIIEDQTTSLARLYGKTASIFPNPSSGESRIELAGIDQCTLIIYDFTGRRVMKADVEDQQMLSFNNLSNGIYLFQLLRNDHEIGKERLVIAK